MGAGSARLSSKWQAWHCKPVVLAVMIQGELQTASTSMYPARPSKINATHSAMNRHERLAMLHMIQPLPEQVGDVFVQRIKHLPSLFSHCHQPQLSQ